MTRKEEPAEAGAMQLLQTIIGKFMNKKKISLLLEEAKSAEYDSFLSGYLALSSAEQSDPDLLMAYADSLYELGRDVDSIDAYLDYAFKFPGRRGFDFALFGAAMAFKNIGMEVEAMYILNLIKSDHPQRSEEILEGQNKIDLQNKAKEILNKYKEKINDGIRR